MKPVYFKNGVNECLFKICFNSVLIRFKHLKHSKNRSKIHFKHLCLTGLEKWVKNSFSKQFKKRFKIVFCLVRA